VIKEYQNRREFLLHSGVLIAGASLAAVPGLAQKAATGGENRAEEVSPTEDLMREHGALNRILLIYDHIATRLENNARFDSAALISAADIVRRFIEQYHEKLEEDYLFPRFEKARRLTDLVATLRKQHEAGRVVTLKILAKADSPKNDSQKHELVASIRSFVRMYRPHEAREDTVLFPALHELVSRHEYDALGEEFENKEHQLFGGEGFQMMVDKIAGIEKGLGIYDLSQFTPAGS
jgi:hemerythrin-like domain-containing protein